MDIDKIIRELDKISHEIIPFLPLPHIKEDELTTLCDAIDMLKTMKAKRPNVMQCSDGIFATCPKCGEKVKELVAMQMNSHFPKYCSECGQRLKWE